MLKLRGPAEDRGRKTPTALFTQTLALGVNPWGTKGTSLRRGCVAGVGGGILLPKSKSSAKRITSPSVTQAVPWGKIGFK